MNVKRIAPGLLLLTSVFCLAACDDDRPAEEVEESLENAGEAAEDAVDDAGDAIDDAADEIDDGV